MLGRSLSDSIIVDYHSDQLGCNACDVVLNASDEHSQSLMQLDMNHVGSLQPRNLHDGEWHSYLELPVVSHGSQKGGGSLLSGPLFFKGKGDTLDGMDAVDDVCDEVPFDYDVCVPQFEGDEMAGNEDVSSDGDNEDVQNESVPNDTPRVSI